MKQFLAMKSFALSKFKYHMIFYDNHTQYKMSSKNSKEKNKYNKRNDGATTSRRSSMERELQSKLEQLAIDQKREREPEHLRATQSAMEKHVKFDEDNVRATYKPEGRSYGLMKIDEPITPYASFGSLIVEDEINSTNDNAFVTRLVGDEIVVKEVPKKLFEKKRSEHYRGEFRKNIPPEPDVENEPDYDSEHRED